MHLANIIGYIIATLFIVLGLLGTIIPALPGLLLMLAGMTLVAYLENFQHLGLISFSILLFLAVFGCMVDFIAGLLGAKMSGASKLALWGAFIGGIVGFLFGILGAIFAPLVGAILGELIARKNAKQAGKVGLGTFIGFLIGTCTKVSCAFAMLTVFALAFVV